MAIRKLDDAGLQAWVDGLIARMQVVGVQAKGERFTFAPLRSATDLRLDYDVTILPPKKLLLPQTETLLTFSTREGYESVVDAEPQVIFGLHPYDVAAIAQMDAIFEQDNPDVHYLQKRAATTIVACDIQTPGANLFAGCMGTAVVHDGYDILLTRVGDQTVVDVATAKGEALLEGVTAADADASDLARREQVWEDNARLMRYHRLDMDPEDLPALLEATKGHPVWAEKADLCYSCGSCNLVCPTCYCFDVQDDVNWDLDSGERKRKWDGCMLSQFALVAGGHNFRENRAARYRHRYYRKGKYLWDRMEQIACVGCGRCITACTANIANPVEIYNTLLEAQA